MPTPQEERRPSVENQPDVPSLAQEYLALQSQELTFKVTLAEKHKDYTLLQVGFGADSTNDQKVIDTKEQVERIGPELFAKPIFVNGGASTNVAVTLGHELAHFGPAVGFFEPATSSYIITRATGGQYHVGQRVPADAEGKPILTAASTNALTPRSGPDRTFIVDIEERTDTYTKLALQFGAASGNDQKVVDALDQARLLKPDLYGRPLFLNGKVSTQVAALVGAELAHIVPAIGTFEPATSSYVISVAHGDIYRVGQTIPADEKGTPLFQ